MARDINKAPHLIKGNDGENIALDYLIKLGYQILETNWSAKKAEIDIIAMNDDILIFIEVKTRKSDEHPGRAVNHRKRKLIASAAVQYMLSINYNWKIRFDIIAITHNTNEDFTLQHFEDAFFPGWE